MTALDLGIASVAVFVGSTLQGSIGFGLGLLASPILILVDPDFVPGPILLATLVVTTFLSVRERDAVDRTGLMWAIVGRIPGTVVAAWLLALLPDEQLATVFGLLVLAGVVMSASGLRIEPGRWVLLTAGALSGVMGTIASIGGPPMALVYQHALGPRLRSTMAVFFWVGTVFSLIALRLVGRFGLHEVRLALMLVPSVLLGLGASRWTSRFVDRGYTRIAVLSVAGTAAVVVIVRQFV